MPTTAPDPIYLTPLEVAARLRTSRGVLANWRSQGRGPAYLKLEGSILYRLSDLEAWEAERLTVSA